MADRFNKLPHEVCELPVEEFNYCAAYISVKAAEEKKAYDEAKNKAKTGRPRGRR